MILCFLDGRFTPKKFYPYAHCVSDRLCSTEDQKTSNVIKQIVISEYLREFPTESPYRLDDNKVVFEFESRTGVRVFVGFFDNVCAIGFSCQKW